MTDDEDHEIHQRCAICCAPRTWLQLRGLFYCGPCHDRRNHSMGPGDVPIPFDEWTKND